MRRTRHRRRFHTNRIIAKRKRRYLLVTPISERLAWPRQLEDGRLAKGDYFDCSRPRCGVCHPGKNLPHNPDRTPAKRRWRTEVIKQLDAAE